MSQTIKTKGWLLGVVALLGTGIASAVPVLTSFDTPSVFYSQDHSLGYAFSSSSNTTIEALGFYDLNGDGFASDHQVGLWDSSANLLGLVNLSAGTGDTLIGDFRYASLSSSVNLLAGDTYFLAGTTSADDWVYQASNILMAGGFSYLGSYYTSGTGATAAFPGSYAGGREYMTVNALTHSLQASVPEPSLLALLSFGLVSLGFARKKA